VQSVARHSQAGVRLRASTMVRGDRVQPEAPSARMRRGAVLGSAARLGQVCGALPAQVSGATQRLASALIYNFSFPRMKKQN